MSKFSRKYKWANRAMVFMERNFIHEQICNMESALLFGLRKDYQSAVHYGVEKVSTKTPYGEISLIHRAPFLRGEPDRTRFEGEPRYDHPGGTIHAVNRWRELYLQLFPNTIHVKEDKMLDTRWLTLPQTRVLEVSRMGYLNELDRLNQTGGPVGEGESPSLIVARSDSQDGTVKVGDAFVLSPVEPASSFYNDAMYLVKVGDLQERGDKRVPLKEIEGFEYDPNPCTLADLIPRNPSPIKMAMNDQSLEEMHQSERQRIYELLHKKYGCKIY